MTKPEVRELSRGSGCHLEQAPAGCLSSRFPYGTEITRERLPVDGFEDGLRALGFRQLRVRFHDAVARLELPAESMPRALEPEVREAIVALGRARVSRSWRSIWPASPPAP